MALSQQGKCDHGFGVVTDLGQDLGFEFVGHRHFAAGNFLFAGADETEFAAAQRIAVTHPDGRTEHAAGHRAPGVDVAAAGGRIERGAGRVVGEFFESFPVFRGCAENSGVTISRKGRAVLVDPGLGAADHFGGKIGLSGAKCVHAVAQPPGIERVDRKGAVAALRAADAAGKPRTGAPRGVDERRIHDLH